MRASIAPKARAPLGFEGCQGKLLNQEPRAAAPVLPPLRGLTLAELHVAWRQKGAGRSHRTEERPLFHWVFQPCDTSPLGKEAGNGCFVCDMEAGPKVPNGENWAVAMGLGQGRTRGRTPGGCRDPWEAVGFLWPCALGCSGITPHFN